MYARRRDRATGEIRSGARELALQACGQNSAEEPSRDQQLRAGRDPTRPVPAGYAMAREELSSARLRQWENVFEIRRRRGERTDCRCVERPSHESQRQHADHPASELEPPRVDVFMRHAIAQEMQHRPEHGSRDR